MVILLTASAALLTIRRSPALLRAWVLTARGNYTTSKQTNKQAQVLIPFIFIWLISSYISAYSCFPFVSSLLHVLRLIAVSLILIVSTFLITLFLEFFPLLLFTSYCFSFRFRLQTSVVFSPFLSDCLVYHILATNRFNAASLCADRLLRLQKPSQNPLHQNEKAGTPIWKQPHFSSFWKSLLFPDIQGFPVTVYSPPTPISFSRSGSSQRTAASPGPSVKGGTRVNELRWEVKIAFNCSSVPFTPSLHLSLLWLCFIKRARRTDTLGQASEQFTC